VVSRPHCPFCDKTIQAHTTRVNAPHTKPSSYIPVRGWHYDGNLQVVHSRYSEILVKPDGRETFWTKHLDEHGSAREREGVLERRLTSVSVWDGDSYDFGYWPFCSTDCARQFARAAYRAGFRMR